ncbi:hypothetical protein Q3G72_013580 [Acer saccharum]|nr:hypothetical protein Q3G72_013580 [Acer saccharum]
MQVRGSRITSQSRDSQSIAELHDRSLSPTDLPSSFSPTMLPPSVPDSNLQPSKSAVLSPSEVAHMTNAHPMVTRSKTGPHYQSLQFASKYGLCFELFRDSVVAPNFVIYDGHYYLEHNWSNQATSRGVLRSGVNILQMQLRRVPRYFILTFSKGIL